jgi:multiple sugar transport system substrate-binding protein
MSISRTRPLRRKRPSRRALLAGTASAAALLSTGCTFTTGGVKGAEEAGSEFSKDPAPGRSTNIELYHPWGDATGRGVVKIAKEFEKAQSDIGIGVTYAPQASEGIQARLLTAIAADDPPDVGLVLPEGSAQLSQYGAMTDLAPYLARDGLGQDSFIEPVWNQMSDGTHVWATNLVLDVNFPLFWNKELFEQNDLDPETPPKTIDDLDKVSEKLLKEDGGSVTTVGIIPWGLSGFSNSMFTWGFAFGGEFLSSDGEVVTADHENNVLALEWMVDYAKRVGGPNRVSVAPPGSTVPPIALGHLAMDAMVSPNYAMVRETDPDLPLGYADVPYAEGLGKPGTGTWLGGWNAFIPSGAKEPDAAWEFLKWATISDDGSKVRFDLLQGLPTTVNSPLSDEARERETTAPYAGALERATNVRPNIPVTTELFSEMEIVVGNAVYGSVTPQKALKQISDTVNSAWDKRRKELQQ